MRFSLSFIHFHTHTLARNLPYKIRNYQAVDFYLSSKDNQSTFNIKKGFTHRKNPILWFVSNCNTRTKRDKIVNELSKYFPINQYGQCSYSHTKENRI